MKYLVIVCLCVAGISSYAARISPLASVNDAEGVIQEEWLYNVAEDKDAPNTTTTEESITTTEESTTTTKESTTTTEESTTTTKESTTTTEESITTTEESTSTTEESSTTNEESSTTTYESSISSEDITTTEITITTTTQPPGLSDGAIAGIVIGSIAAAVLLAGGIYFMKIKGIACFG